MTFLGSTIEEDSCDGSNQLELFQHHINYLPRVAILNFEFIDSARMIHALGFELYEQINAAD